MMRSLWIAKTGMEGQQSKLDAISNNLANVGTNGFKRSGVAFEDLMYQNLRPAGSASSDQTQLPTGLQVGLGVRAAATTRNFGQGSLQQTGNNLDVAIKGEGFFQIQLPDGSTGYTRDGGFQTDATGQVVNNAGYVLQPGLTIPGQCQRHHHQPRRHRQRYRVRDRPRRSSWVSCSWPRSSIRPDSNRVAATSISRPPRRARPTPQRPVLRWPWAGRAGLRRGQQRQRGRGTGQHDRDAARVRAEFEGDPDL